MDVYVVRRSFNAAIVNRQPYAGDVDAAGLRAQGAGGADLRFFHVDDASAGAAANIDFIYRDSVEGRICRFNLAGLRARDRRRRRSVFNFHAQVFRRNALLDFRVC